MAISYNLGFNPKWYFADLVGRPLGGGYLATFSNLDNTQINFVYEDPAGQFPWPYVTIPNAGKLGILIDENGTQGPFYFAFNSATPQALYFLEVYDSNGVLQWTINNYIPSTGTGGSIITTTLGLKNLIVNNIFWRNVGLGSSISVSNNATLLAPGCHAGLAATPANAGPDIYLLKNNTSSTETISFPTFSLGFTALPGDVTPVQYFNFTCTAAGTETTKCVQFPIISKVQNLTTQTVTLKFFARGNSGTMTLLPQWRQFFGDGTGASPDVITPIQSFVLNNLWQPFTVTTTVPSVTGKVLGPCGNDALFLQFQFPLTHTFNIDFTKPSLYLGTITPNEDFDLYDSIDGTLNVPRTGDLRSTLGSAPPGWVLMNDGTIGNGSSNATTRAYIDTFPLFNLIWNAVGSTYAPMFTSTGTPTAYGASAIADFDANNQISLTKQLGRALASLGLASSGGSTTWALGQFFGEQNHTMTLSELVTHNHTFGIDLTTSVGNAQNSIAVNQGISQHSVLNSPVNTTGSSTPFNITQPTTFYNFIMKL